MDFVGPSEEKLKLLGDDTTAYIGRKKSVHAKYGEEGAILLGRSAEKPNYGQKVYLDALSPHVVFITGARGSGKSYACGVIAEELVLKNPNVACVVIDPVGIFWSMKYPNKEKRELEILEEWGLEPRGIQKTRVFVPRGVGKKIPKQTYDRLFSLRPNELTVDDWCLTFGIERFSPTGLLLEKAIEKSKAKYKNYSLEELIKTIEKDPELSSKERGYKMDSRRALISRLEAAKSWGVLSKEGTSLAEVCKEGYISVIDISFLEENVASLVIGMLAKKILNARKMVTRQAAMSKYVGEMEDIDELLNVDIPPTWLFIDEAHTLIPSGTGKTAATSGLVEYVKQGRRPGCSLVFATQQPSAIDTKVLSQLDLLLCHKLVFDEDIKAVVKRMPTTFPDDYKKKFIKKLPIGVALTGDRSDETSRAFCIHIRPRFSQHEGREIKSIEVEDMVDPEKIKELLANLIYKKVEETGGLSLTKIEELTDTIQTRYNIAIDSDEMIQKVMREKNCILEGGKLTIPGFEEQKELEAELGGELKAIGANINKEDAKKFAEKNRKKKMLGLIGKEEELKEIEMIYEPIYKVNFDIVLGKGYSPKTIYVDTDHEIFYFHKGMKKTKDVSEILPLNERKVRVLNALHKTTDKKRIAKITKLTPQAVGRYLSDLTKENLVRKDENKQYRLVQKLDIPSDLRENKYEIKSRLVERKPGNYPIEQFSIDEKILKKIPGLFNICKVKSVETLLKPVWKATYLSGSTVRVQKFDAI